jgi:hypothetical protein
LGIEITSGVKKRFHTANSSFDAYGHELEIDAFGIRTFATVYFFEDPLIRKNVLGRSGWLDRVRIGISDYDRAIYLAAYTEDDGPHTPLSPP